MFAMKNGLTVREPFSRHAFVFSISSNGPPPPEPKTTPISSRLLSSTFRSESASACFAAATPITTLRSVRRIALKSIHCVPSKSLISPAAWASYGVGSQRVIRLRPDLPADRLSHIVSMSWPMVLMTPRPVTATRREKSGRRTSGTRPGERDWYGKPPARGLVVDGERLGIRCDSLDEAGQDLAGTDLDEACHAGPAHSLDRRDPVDAARQVLHELGATVFGRR